MAFNSGRLFFLFFSTVLISQAFQTSSNGFTFSTISFPGATSTVAYGVNTTGQIVGGENANSGIQNGFLSTGGAYTTFNVPPGSAAGSYAEGVNNSAQIVGLNLATGTGFLQSGGTSTAINVPGSDSGTTNATGINDSGQVVGTFLMGGVQYGFWLAGGVYTTINVPGASATAANGINNNGQIVGWYTAGGGTFGFELSVGNYTTVSFPGAASTKAFGINNSGQIVGQYSSGGLVSGFLLEGGNYTSISVPGSSSTEAFGINDAGQIVGSYASGGVVLGYSAAQNAATVLVNEYQMESALTLDSVSGIAASPGGVWFAVTTTIHFPSLEILDVSNTGVIIGGGGQSGLINVSQITAGPDGAIWFTYGGIGELSTSGEITLYPGSAKAGIVAGPDGALWVADGDSIGRMTTSGSYVDYVLPTANAATQGITNGPDGALWFTEAGSGKIGRITTSGTNITEYPLPTTGASPQGITTGPDGALWFTEPNIGKVGRITTGGMITEYIVPSGETPGTSIAAGSDGALWFTAGAYVGRITTAGIVTEYQGAGGGATGGIAAGPDGAVWFPVTGLLPSAPTTIYTVSVDQVVINPNGAAPPALSITNTNAGTFTQGQANVSYTLTVSNQSGAGSTVGAVTVTDTLPSGLSLVSMNGSGWSCSANSCTNSNVLQGNASYPPITVTVNVAANATSPQVNQALVSGGGAASASASDSTAIIANPPQLGITKTHFGSFTQGQANAAYTVTVSNLTGAGPTVGAVTVTDALPSGLTLVSMTGVGWNCTGNGCTRSDPLSGGTPYPSIIVTVNVSANASSPQVNLASVSGGGTASAAGASDSTAVTAAPASLAASPPALSYSYVWAGTVPSAQSLNISSMTGSATSLAVAGAGSCAWLNASLAATTAPTTLNTSINTSGLAALAPGVYECNVSVSGASMNPVTAPVTLTIAPAAFFAGEVSVGSGVSYLQFTDGIPFSYFAYLSGNWIDHFDLGYAWVDPGNGAEVYLWDLATGHWWYTNTADFPYLYDFTLVAWIYYIPNPAVPGTYMTNPRQFAYTSTHVVFTM